LVSVANEAVKMRMEAPWTVTAVGSSNPAGKPLHFPAIAT
jgi:hypothetical protein